MTTAKTTSKTVYWLEEWSEASQQWVQLVNTDYSGHGARRAIITMASDSKANEPNRQLRVIEIAESIIYKA